MKSMSVLEIHEIELSSICNLACTYCPHPTLQRSKDHMPWHVFELALSHVRYYRKQGTQGEVALTGIGEAILYPHFEDALRLTREALGPDGKITLSTNGVAMTRDIARLLAIYGVGVYVSLHRPEVAAPALQMVKDAGCAVAHNYGFVDSSLDWAGQVEWHVSAPRVHCGYLTQGWAVIRQNGNIDACCMDAHDLHPIGTVWDAPGSLRTRVTPLCANCNFRIPDHLKEEAA